MFRLIAATATVAMAASLSACGGPPPLHGDARQAADTVHAFWHHLLRDEYRQACALLTPAAQAQIGRFGAGDCELGAMVMESSYSAAEKDGLDRITYRRVTVTGDRATIADPDIVIPRSIAHLRAKPNGRPIVLRRVQGRWLIADHG
jgi:hypothetical protein